MSKTPVVSGALGFKAYTEKCNSGLLNPCVSLIKTKQPPKQNLVMLICLIAQGHSAYEADQQ